MGHGVHRFLGNVDPNLICAICGGVFDEAVLTPCGHAYCAQCLQTWLSRENTRTCPECRAAVACGDARPVLALRNLIGAMTVECENSERGCKIVTKLENMAAHRSVCGYAPAQCAHCGLQMARYELNSHGSECEAQQTPARGEEGRPVSSGDSEERFSRMLMRVASLEMQSKRVRRELDLEQLKCKRLPTELQRRADALEEIRGGSAARECRHSGQPPYFDADYQYGSTPQSLPTLSHLISRFLLNKPAYVDADRVFDCVRRSYETFGRAGEQREKQVLMLLAVASASDWFSDEQRLSFHCWIQTIVRYRPMSHAVRY